MSRTRMILQDAINDGLSPLGEPIVKTIVWHLRANGMFLNSQQGIDVHEFYSHLEAIVGNIADMVINEIYESLQKRYSGSPIRFDPDTSVLDRIDQLVNMNVGGTDTC